MSGPAGKLAFPVNSRLLQAVNLSRLLAIDSDVICQIINIISLKKKTPRHLGLFLPSLSEWQSHVSRAAGEWFSEVTVVRSQGWASALVFLYVTLVKLMPLLRL